MAQFQFMTKDLFVGQTAQIKAASQGTPAAIANVLIPKITHL